MVRLALIGGDVEHAYAAATSRVPGAVFTAVVGDDAGRAERMATTLGAAVVAASLDDLVRLHSDEFDAALIHSTPDRHAAHAEPIARAGKHVFVAVPLAPATVDADAIINACETAGVRLMVGHVMRFAPSTQAVEHALATGKLGAPGLLRIHRWEPRAEAGALRRAMHDVDLANWFFGALPTHVYAVGRRPADSAEESFDYVQVHLGFPAGGMALIDSAVTLPTGQGYFSLSMIGADGAAYADDHHDTHLLFRGRDPAALLSDSGARAGVAQLREFVSAIDEDRVPAVTGADGRAAIRVCEAAAESIRSGRVVQLAAPDGRSS